MKACGFQFFLLYFLTKVSRIVQAHHQHFAVIGGTKSFHCKAGESLKNVVVVWKLNEEQICRSTNSKTACIKENYSSSFDSDRDVVVLHISNITFSDAGNYTCIIVLSTVKFTYYTLQVQSPPDITVFERSPETMFTARCCARFALPWNQTKITWTKDDRSNVSITNELHTSSYLHSRTERCSVILVKIHIINRDEILTCVTENKQLFLSTYLNMYNSYLIDIKMLTSLKLRVEKGEVATIQCQTGVSNNSLVHLQKMLYQDTWITLNTSSKRKPHRGDLFLYQFDIESSEAGTYKCILANDDEPYAESETCLVVLTESDTSNVSTTYGSMAFGFVLCVILLALLWLIHRFYSKIIFTRRRKTSQGQDRNGSRQRIPLPSLPKSQSNRHRRNGYTKEESCHDINEGASTTEEDFTVTTMIHYGKRRVRFKGLLHQGSNQERIIHAFTSLETSGEDHEWLSFCSSILKLSQHANIVKTIDVCLQEGVTYCIQEHLPFGSLRKHLKTNRSYHQPTVELSSYANDVISGLLFLHSFSFLHPGLCARKVLMTNGGKLCKLYDFCLKENVNEVVSILSKSNKLKINFSPESVYDKTYSEASDVWATGVILWEIFSHGAKLPMYGRMKSTLKHTDIKRMLFCPRDCPYNIYEEMVNCWEKESQTRSSLATVEQTIKATCTAYAVVTVESIVDDAADLDGSPTSHHSYQTEIFNGCGETEFEDDYG